jgi:hypothetical protein
MQADFFTLKRIYFYLVKNNFFKINLVIKHFGLNNSVKIKPYQNFLFREKIIQVYLSQLFLSQFLF